MVRKKLNDAGLIYQREI